MFCNYDVIVSIVYLYNLFRVTVSALLSLVVPAH